MTPTIVQVEWLDDYMSVAWLDSPLMEGDTVETIPYNPNWDVDPSSRYKFDVPTEYAPQQLESITNGQHVFRGTPKILANGNMIYVYNQLWNGYGPTAITIRSANGVRSVPFSSWKPKIDGLWRKTVRQGDTTLVWGKNLNHVFLVDKDNKLHKLEITTDFAAWDLCKTVKVHVPPGEYKLVCHSGGGGQLHWSNERSVTVVPQYKPTEYLIASAFVDASSNVSNLQSKIDKLNTKGGGTLYIKPGRYRLNQTLKLYPNITLEGDQGVVFERMPVVNGPCIFPADFCVIRRIRFESLNGGYVFWSNLSGRYMELDRCELYKCSLGEWDREGLYVHDCFFDQASANQITSNSFFMNNRWLGWREHPVSIWGAKDCIFVNNKYTETDRGTVSQPHRGSIIGCFFWNTRYDKIDATGNGNEHVLAEGGYVSPKIPAVWNSKSECVCEYPPELLPYNLVLAIKRYPNGVCETRLVKSFNAETKTLVVDEPFLSDQPTDVEFALGFAFNNEYFARINESRGHAVLLYSGYTAHNKWCNTLAHSGLGVQTIAEPTMVSSKTHQQNVFSNWDVRNTAGFDFNNAGNYNLVAKSVVTSPVVSNANQDFFYDEYHRQNAVFRSSGGVGNVAVDCYVANGSGFELSRGVELHLVKQDGTLTEPIPSGV